jgi:hypothetical protein
MGVFAAALDAFCEAYAGLELCKLVTYDAGACSARYLVSSLPRSRLTAEHWLLVIRRHWGVETAHQILDTAFAEDAHPWIESNPRGSLVVAILRRIAYTILTLFRSITQRSEERRHVPWKALLEDVFFALVSATDAELGPRAALAEGPD